MTIASFQPIENDKSEVLILGTMPSRASISANQYYAHKDNLFWDIMFRVLDPNWKFDDIVDVDYSQKVELLLNNNIALWDVLQYCDRKGSLDTNIKNEIKNDLANFFLLHKNIKAIFFNGKKAHEYFCEIKNSIININTIEQIVLQSTSPSNTKNSFQILKQYQLIKTFIKK